MKIGILADTHDNLDAVSYWMEFFNQQEADVLIHAGDFVSPFVVPEMDRFQGPIYGVYGNNDGDRETLHKKAQGTDITLSESYERLELSGAVFGVAHKPSDLPEQRSPDVTLYVHGHTHERKWSNEASVPVANPGEAGGWLTGTSSALTVRTDSSPLQHQFHLVPSP